MNLYQWLGADADSVWRDYAEQAERDAEAMRHLAEAVDE